MVLKWRLSGLLLFPLIRLKLNRILFCIPTCSALSLKCRRTLNGHRPCSKAWDLVKRSGLRAKGRCERNRNEIRYLMELTLHLNSWRRATRISLAGRYPELNAASASPALLFLSTHLLLSHTFNCCPLPLSLSLPLLISHSFIFRLLMAAAPPAWLT